MYLRKIEIHGFKSFADKISLEFESGITAVVGPNGSGKSNIADAVRWVLGEQSVKTLRGSKMEDVIFSGTEQRKPVNFSEVSLILDNSDKTLPVDYSEVNISRRIFRSGESEYYINKSACRLKDIHELFMDTGIGKDGYSIIGQGRIDEILSSKSEDRRNVFEEAAGIMKYKTRKNEAERKLEATKQNLVRINDIIGELEIQLDPLKEQSVRAKKYLELAENLKILDINIFIDSYNKLKEKVEAFKLQFNDIELQYNECAKKIELLGDSQTAQDEQNKQLENEILGLNQKIFEFENNIEKINSEISLCQERITNSKENRERFFNEINEHRANIDSLNGEISVSTKKLNDLNSHISEINNQIGKKEEELRAKNELIEQSVEKIEELKIEIFEKHNEISSKRGSINSINVLLDNINNRKTQINEEIGSLNNDKAQKKLQYDSVFELIAELKSSINNLEEDSKKAALEKEKFEKNIKENIEKLERLRDLITTKTSRYNLLSDMEKEYEGFSKSVKVVLQKCEQSKDLGNGVHGALVQLINVPKEYETAIDVALGGALQNIVTDNETVAGKLIEYLKANNLGRATFLPISSVKTRGFDASESDITSQKGAIGLAGSLINYDKKYSGIIGNLLGRVLIVDNMANGVSISKKYNYSFKVVTLEGEVLSPGGSISGGSINKATSLLSRAREIEELSNDIKRLNIESEELTIKNNKVNEDLNKIALELDNSFNHKKQQEISLVTKESEYRQYNDYFEMLEERIKVLEIETGQLDEQYNSALNQIENINKYILELNSEIETMTQKTSTGQESYKKDIEDKDKLAEEITALKIKLSGYNQELIAVNENIDRLNNSQEQINVKVSENTSHMGQIDNYINEQNTLISKNQEELIVQNNSKETTKAVLDEKICKKTALETEIGEIKNQWRDYNNNLTTLSEEKNRVEIKLAKFEMELEGIQNRVWEDYEMTYTKCLEYKQDISRFGSPNKAINEIKSSISALGNINVSAIEEYVKVKERFEFMSNQRDDLESAEKSLRKVIYDMLQIMKKQFIEQFEILNISFNEVFKELFGGGRAHLKLTDEENVLECGIEIEAQPPGKKLQNLTLLSGGERALTAIAILFAMLKVRPTPFCVLDEIEAALDDVNVYRFAEYIKNFSEKTQFLVITHRKGTMESADSIYGVTMQEHGISKLVSVKLGE